MRRRENLEEIAQRWIGLWCAPVDWELFENLHAEHFEDCSAAGRAPTKSGFAEGLFEMVQAFPDLQTAVDGLVVDELRSTVAVRWVARGTNEKRFLGIGPTKKLTTIKGIEIIEVQDNRIIRRWGEWDISNHLEGT